MYDELQNLTAKSWIIFDNAKNEYCRGYNTLQKL